MAEETENTNTNDDIEGCDCQIDEADMTPDEDLPAAKGGVE